MVPNKYFKSPVPKIIEAAGPRAEVQYMTFYLNAQFTTNTKTAYWSANYRFLDWCGSRGLELHGINSDVVLSYFHNQRFSASALRQHLSAIRKLFDWLADGKTVIGNPTTAIKTRKFKSHDNPQDRTTTNSGEGG